MPVTNPEKKITVPEIERELAELEASYRARKRALRALLAVLKDEEPKANADDKALPGHKR